MILGYCILSKRMETIDDRESPLIFPSNQSVLACMKLSLLVPQTAKSSHSCFYPTILIGLAHVIYTLFAI
jgi:hypothetical protein